MNVCELARVSDFEAKTERRAFGLTILTTLNYQIQRAEY